MRRPYTEELRDFVRPGRLRFKALVAVVLVVMSPVFFVWTSRVWDTTARWILVYGLDSSTRYVMRTHLAGTLDPESVSAAHGIRIRVLDPDGAVLLDANGESRPLWHAPVSDAFFGPDGRPSAVQFDAGRPPITERPEWEAAKVWGQARSCVFNEAATLLSCANLWRTPTGWLHVQDASTRSARALYADRFQMLQLSLSTLLFAVLLTVWLSSRWVRPLEDLRDQARQRARGLSTRPLDVPRNDELGEVADAFNQLMEALALRNRSNEAFAADLAHELKNPLAAVRTAAEALAPGRPLTEARAARLKQILDDSSERMGFVIERFLELARAEAGLQDTAASEVDLFALASNLASRFQAGHDDRRFVVEGKPVAVRARAERLETALRNLLANAASFAGPDGTVTVRVGDAPPSVSVQDTGPGIAPDDLPHVFDRYFTRRQGGTGLGLALAKAIAEANGATLEVRSTLGEGATFTIRW